MGDRGDMAWLDHVDELALQSLIKLVLIVSYLLLFLVLVSFLPGLDQLLLLLPISVPGIVSTIVTIPIVLLLLQIASRSKQLIHQLRSPSTESTPVIAAIVYWTVIFLAILITYEGFGDTGRYLFASADVRGFYPLIFAILAGIPIVLILLHLTIYVQSTKHVDEDSPISATQFRSNQGHIIDILDTHGGIARQSELPEATGWSKTKVSRVLSNMEEDGSITRYQLGREKVVCIPGHEPDFVTSPTDDPDKME